METLGHIVENDCLDKQVFLSNVPIFGKGSSRYYMVETKEGSKLRVFPMDQYGEKLIATEHSVRLFYKQHECDTVKQEENFENVCNRDFGYLDGLCDRERSKGVEYRSH